MKILMVLTSHDKLGDTGKKTGFWLEEFAAPYYVFKEAGAEITLASPKGGQPPLDPTATPRTPRPRRPNVSRRTTRRRGDLANTDKLADVSAGDFDAVFYPGGHGPLWDLAEDADSIKLIESFIADERPMARSATRRPCSSTPRPRTAGRWSRARR